MLIKVFNPEDQRLRELFSRNEAGTAIMGYMSCIATELRVHFQDLENAELDSFFGGFGTGDGYDIIVELLALNDLESKKVGP